MSLIIDDSTGWESWAICDKCEGIADLNHHDNKRIDEKIDGVVYITWFCSICGTENFHEMDEVG